MAANQTPLPDNPLKTALLTLMAEHDISSLQLVCATAQIQQEHIVQEYSNGLLEDNAQLRAEIDELRSVLDEYRKAMVE